MARQRIWVLLIGIGLCAAGAAEAKPLLKGGKNGKPPVFPKGSTINVCIAPDPKNEGRDQLLKEGVERWKAELKARGITLDVTIDHTDEPKKANRVHYRWVNDGVLNNGMEIGPGANSGAAQPIRSKDGSKLVGGEAVIRNALKGQTDAEKAALRNVGEHEFAHVLGLADDSTGAVVKHEQSNAPRTLNDSDLKELNFLYGTATTGGNKKPQGKIQQVGGGASQGFFQYQMTFVPANAAPDPLDPEHVSLVTLDIAPSLVQSIDLPPGWLAYVASGEVLLSDPFFSEGYMLDGAGDPPPWDPDDPLAYIALRASAEEALRDGLPEGFDPSLSWDIPLLGFTLYTGGQLTTGTITAWAGGDAQSVTGPVVPEPAGLLGFGLLSLAASRARRRRPHAAHREDLGDA